ncbi:hypothetical protein ACHMW6_06120 [Pseudoduganella sp. UC29_106]|uniref:hypothetical protein n=1 Tax=Pseudoduganella sp. UC29_106 TaxID=3374553 RepID=UPI0037569252
MEVIERVLNTHSSDYDEYVQRINDRFNTITGPIFETDAAGLYEAYLASFTDAADRQYHTCSCCKQFIERFGGLVMVDTSGGATNGLLIPAIWDEADAPEHYKPAIAAMARLVRRAKITMPFLSSEQQYGTLVSVAKATRAVWHHFGVRPVASRIFRGSRLKNAFQAASEKREEYNSVSVALSEYSKDTCDTALRLLKNDQLGNSEAVLGQAQFLVDLHAARADSMNMHNTTWHLVASAPAGFCHPRSSMIATLLDDIQAGKSFEQAEAAWNAKMHPLRYQRPKAAPSAGNIAAAEKMFAELGLAPALKRRIARLDEIPKIWEPRAQPVKPEGGVFGHLIPKGAATTMSMAPPAISITMEKFARTVAPDAEKIEVQLGSRANFIAITTAVEADAPKLFQWDHPFAWYVWHGGAMPSQYGLSVGWVNVVGITRLPARWNDEGTDHFKHHGDGIILLVDGARETRVAGNALFPACLRAELREVRSTIESFSKRANMEGLKDGSAIGIDLRQGGEAFPVNVRVTSAGQIQSYKIDRWD